MNYCKCLKCKEKVLADEKELGRNGCPHCQGKKFEWKVYDREIEDSLNWITEECSECHLLKVVDILNYEEIKGKLIKNGVKSKQEAIKKMNDNKDNYFCYCGNLKDDDRERERERQKNWETTEKGCQIRGYYWSHSSTRAGT